MNGKTLFAIIALLNLSACGEGPAGFIAKKFTLDNGAQLIVLPDNRFPIITQMIWYPVGAGDEVKTKTGLAHFLEHLMFQHQPHLAIGGFSNFIETIGGSDNAFTSYDYTAYYQRFHPAQFEKVMALEAGRMRGLALAEKSALKERGVIIEELNTRLNTNPLSRLRQKMRAALFGSHHPYGRDVIGYLDDIKNLNKTDADQFYKKHYDPARAIIIIAGDIDPELSFALAQKHYGTIDADDKTSAARGTLTTDFPTILQRQNKNEIIFHRDKRTQQAVLLRDYVVTNRHILGARAAASFEVLAEILIGSSLSRLKRYFVVEEKIASFVGGGLLLDRRGPGKFSIQIWLSPQQKLTQANLKKIYDKLNKILSDIAANKTPPTLKEIATAKNRLLAQAIYLKDSPTQLANYVGSWLITGHDLETALNNSQYIKAVNARDLRAAALYMLSSDRALTGFLLPNLKQKTSR